MTLVLRRILARLYRWSRDLRDFSAALAVAAVFHVIRLVPAEKAAGWGGFIARKIGRMLPVSERVGMANLRRAFPHKDEAWHRAVLSECWDNLGRVAVEYCHLDHIWDLRPDDPAAGRIDIVGVEHFYALRDDNKPAIIISAHLGNWELPMVAASAHGLEAAALFRAPNNRWIARWVYAQRKVTMGELIASRHGSMHALSAVLERGVHLGMLTDQYFYAGIRSAFFGIETLNNQAFARLARLHDCPVHAVRVVRLPGYRFRVELSEPLALPRDQSGRIDPAGAVDVMNRRFESWISEYPGQWLWLHRKWR
ncbi:MAG: lipid A biosynthesis lauroyl acyltransferase [Hyphomicrobiales bacterium]|nr:lipid A biosynthesis lauroyl acyltransferase [Hyphomicrobiales bacterium]OQW83475.1 MAG: hypothetical protein BVN31_05710 [Proteobacteria bacterium ST_bin15]